MQKISLTRTVGLFWPHTKAVVSLGRERRSDESTELKRTRRQMLDVSAAECWQLIVMMLMMVMTTVNLNMIKVTMYACQLQMRCSIYFAALILSNVSVYCML